MSERLGARLTVLRECAVISETPAATRKWAEVLVRKVPDDHSFVDVRIAVLGNVESGKSTLVSVLTHNELDNGQGRARLNLLRHIHEIRSGRTSSINNGIMGFDDQAEVQNFGNCSSTDEICLRSSKIVTFIDLAGHSKYMKTTVFGLTGYVRKFLHFCIKYFFNNVQMFFNNSFSKLARLLTLLCSLSTQTTELVCIYLIIFYLLPL